MKIKINRYLISFLLNMLFVCNILPQGKSDYSPKIPLQIQQQIETLHNFGITNNVMSYRLAFQNIGIDKLSELKKYGLDLVAISQDVSKSTYKDLTVTSDGVLIGTVTGISYNKKKNACYHTNYTIKIKQILKKPRFLTNLSELTLIKVDGPLEGGLRLQISESVNFEKGATYLFFISNSAIKYFLDNVSHCNETYKADKYIAANTSPRIINNKVWLPYSDKKIPLIEFLEPLNKIITVINR